MGEILDQASAGERIVVERDRRPLAVLVPYEDAIRLEESPAEARARALAALDRLQGFAHHFAPGSESAAIAVRLDREQGHGTSG